MNILVIFFLNIQPNYSLNLIIISKKIKKKTKTLISLHRTAETSTDSTDIKQIGPK